MNRERRRKLKLVLSCVEQLTSIIEDINDRLQDIIDEEEEAINNLPENMQSGERAQKMNETIMELQDIQDAFDDLDIPTLYKRIEEFTLE